MLLRFLFSLFVGIIGIWSIKRQKQIFNVTAGENLAGGLHRIITEFRRFYLIINLQVLVMLPALFYLIIPAPWSSGIAYNLLGWIAKHLDLMLPYAAAKPLCCLGFTVLIMALNHWYYRRAYFTRIKQMQQNLNELSAA